MTQLHFHLPHDCLLSLWLPNTETYRAEQVRNMIERLIELHLCRDQFLSRSTSGPKDKLSFLITRLFNPAGAESLSYIASAGQIAGYDFTLPYCVCALEVTAAEIDELSRENLLRSVMYLIRSFHRTSLQDLVAPLSGSRIVICKQIRDMDAEQREQLNAYFDELFSRISEKFGIGVRVGIGDITRGITDFSNSLIQARAALKYAGIYQPHRSISFYQDYSIEDEISKIPMHRLTHFLEHYCADLDKYPPLLEMLEALIETNMDISRAAKVLFIHRNTAVYRMEQLKEMFGLNPLHSDSDRFTLITIYVYYKLSRRDK
jgi:carbohydrate diacid regulator